MDVVELAPGAPFVDPDVVKVPESPEHRRIVDLIAQQATLALGHGVVCYCDMNWYPTDGGPAVAPDVQVLPAGLLPEGARSYRQGDLGGPPPLVVVEVPSESDGYSPFREKLRRYQRLGVTVYVIDHELTEPAALRLAPEDAEPGPWLDRPCPELGGIRFAVNDGCLGVRRPDGTMVTSAEDFTRRRDQDAATAEHRAAEAERRMARLEERLRQLGGDPGDERP